MGPSGASGAAGLHRQPHLYGAAADAGPPLCFPFSGRLLAREQLNEMFAVPLGSTGNPLHYADGSDCDTGPAKGTACYGAGLKSVTLPDGTVLWGKTGHDIGYASGVFATRDLKLRTVYAVGTSTADSSGSLAVANRLIAVLLTPPQATTAAH